MRCYICDATLSEVHFNRDHDKFDPCPFCLDVIQDTLEGFLDRPFVDDDELGVTDPLQEAFPSLDRRYNGRYSFSCNGYDTEDDEESS